MIRRRLSLACVVALISTLLLGQDSAAQTDPCNPDPCAGIPNAVPDTCVLIPGGVCAPDDFTCDCDPGYDWQDATNTCEEEHVQCVDEDTDTYYAIDPVNCPEGDDCDDGNADVNPGAEEVCGDGVDNDCDGTEDGEDDDQDTYIDEACGGDDCDDSNAEVHPGAEEVCGDGIDQDCSGSDIVCYVWIETGIQARNTTFGMCGTLASTSMECNSGNVGQKVFLIPNAPPEPGMPYIVTVFQSPPSFPDGVGSWVSISASGSLISYGGHISCVMGSVFQEVRDATVYQCQVE